MTRFFEWKLWYRNKSKRNPLLWVGAPFMGSILLVWVFAIPIAQIKFTRRDEQVKTLTKEEQLDLNKRRRKVNVNEEYYRIMLDKMQQESGDYENKRVPRLSGEPTWEPGSSSNEAEDK
ncbi:mitochondrial copper chaperone for cytochrome c oxidase Cox16 [Schizosaccharomyces osmophilus]|uniref:Cytochrome c oxidase assembly protein COX16, mitochondrial n=1 Tax=Schizosaccharomyces osmophilus TaxID=2545709 RepID=A0AAE9WC60_9SCHI|nr:mitochondrial copper chaperone for cytochrome c oxidase Cox16 [Schizosaccharomyces osmophilus]WBW72522.1 mitochondrial copper chaperone for cytochrome c oxidase Cox16 [Schizosaccharomyces osmophilus]